MTFGLSIVFDDQTLGRPGLSQGMKDEIRAMRTSGMSIAKIVNELGVSGGVVCKVVNG
jgi:hypothetical protein